MGDVVSLADKRRERETKVPPKPKETTKEPTLEMRLDKIRASITRINELIAELRRMNHDATDCRR
jgi:hypothetical protein